MTRISKPPQERRKEILDAAMEMFMKNGYENTSVSDIVQKLNVAQGLFYYYFKSKEEVFRAALEQYTDEFTGKLVAIVRDSSLSFRGRIERILKTMTDLFSEADNALSNEIHRGEYMDMDYRLSMHAAQTLVEPVSELLEELNERGVTQIKDTHLIASFLVFGIFGLIHSSTDKVHNNDYLKTEVIAELISHVLGIYPETLAGI